VTTRRTLGTKKGNGPRLVQVKLAGGTTKAKVTRKTDEKEENPQPRCHFLKKIDALKIAGKEEKGGLHSARDPAS